MDTRCTGQIRLSWLKISVVQVGAFILGFIFTSLLISFLGTLLDTCGGRDRNCSVWEKIEENSSRPVVYVATPTYRNPRQLSELTRTAQALYPARAFIHWLIWEDTDKTYFKFPGHLEEIAEYLIEYFPNLRFEVNWSSSRKDTDKIIFLPKGVEARRDTIKFIRDNKKEGVLYFADDDNTYDSQIFQKIQNTKKVSIWPVGAITTWGLSSPVVNTKGNVVDFFDGFKVNRKYPLDFSGFAVNTKVVRKNPKSNVPYIAGYEETVFLGSLNISRKVLKPICSGATEVLTWHTKTYKPTPPWIRSKQESRLKLTNILGLYRKYSFRLRRRRKQ